MCSTRIVGAAAKRVNARPGFPMGTRLIAPAASGRSVSRSIPDQSSLSFASRRLPSISSKPVSEAAIHSQPHSSQSQSWRSAPAGTIRKTRTSAHLRWPRFRARRRLPSRRRVSPIGASQRNMGHDQVVRMEVRADFVQLDAMIRVTEHSRVSKRFHPQRCWVQRNCVRIKRSVGRHYVHTPLR